MPPYLDTNPIGVTLDYPIGIGLTLLRGYLAQGDALPTTVVGSAILLVVFLAGVKIVIDRLDRAFDASIDKRTVPVAVGDWASVTPLSLCFTATTITTFALVTIDLFPATACLRRR